MEEQSPQRRGAANPNERDDRVGRQLIESLVAAWRKDAELLGASPGAGRLLASAGEAVEFAIGDPDRSAELFAAAARHDDADPRAFAGVRRQLRNGDERAIGELASLYQRELAGARTSVQALLAAVGYAQCALREGESADTIVGVLHEASPLLSQAPVDVAAVFRATLEDALLAAGREREALDTRIKRWGEMRQLGDDVADVFADLGALAIAVASDAIGAGDAAVLRWYEAAFEARPSVDAALPILRSAYDSKSWERAGALLAELSESLDDTNARGTFQYELGLVRAMRLDDRPGGLASLSASMRGGHISPLAATTYLGLARSSQGAMVADEFIDALGASIDFAASGVERADLFTQMAERFESDHEMSAAAVDLARDALAEHPEHVPAIRLLGSIYAREGRWDALVELTEQQLEYETYPEDRFRLHDQLADLYDRHLAESSAAERHLRAACEIRAELGVVRRLARLLGEQYRWQELFDHLRVSAARIDVRRETAYLLERAGEIADAKLRDGGLAIEVYRELLDLAPDHPSAMTSLGRLLSRHERWQELLALNERELALTEDEHARVGILCRSAEVARQHLGDLRSTELYLQRALEEDPACAAALRGLGSILSAQARWDELIAMTEAEMSAARSERHRRRCLRMLGETLARRMGEHDRAIRCFEELADGEDALSEEARMWLERLYESAGRTEDQLRVLLLRFEAAEDPDARGRLAFRVAELLEWRLSAPGDAFEYYVESLVEPTAAPVALRALDRLWKHEEVEPELRREAVRCLRALADERDDELRREALSMLAERARDLVDGAERLRLHQAIAADWPEDLRSAEYAAVSALLAGEAAEAEQLRAAAPAGPVEAVRSSWAQLDQGWSGWTSLPAAVESTPVTAEALGREVGVTQFAFVGASEREIFQRLGAGSLSVGELTQPDDSEASQRLAAYAHRALGDMDGMRDTMATLAESLSGTVRGPRVWLELAYEEGFRRGERIDWLNAAAAEGFFNSPVRKEVYEAMTTLGAYDSLEVALADHLGRAKPAPEEAARLSLRRGRCLDTLSRRSEAIEALRYSAIHAPGDASVALEKARLETLVDDLDEARITLEDCLNAGVAGDHRLEVLGRLAELHLMPGGERQRALSALEDAFTLSDAAFEWAVRLASAHESFGNATRCVELLEAALPSPPREDDVRHWQLLARALSVHVGQPDEAERILWDLFESFPMCKAALTGLEEHYRRSQGARQFADRLGAMLAEGELRVDDARRGDLWRYVGELNFTVLERYAEAQDAYARARAVVGSDAATLLREARAAGKQPGRLRDAASLVVEALDAGSDDARLWEDASVQLESLYAELAEPARLRVARQLRQALGSSIEIDDALVKREPSRELDPELAWQVLGDPMLSADAVSVLQGSVGLAEKVLSRYAPPRKDHKGRRLRADEFGGFDRFLTSACQWLGVARPRVMIGDREGSCVSLDSSTFWLPASAVDEERPRSARFWAGHLAGLMFSDLVPYTWVNDAMTRDLLVAVGKRGGLPVCEGLSSCLEDDVSGLLVTPQRRQALAALTREPEVLSDQRPRWRDAVLRVADRAGLVACGDLAAAVRELAKAEGYDGDLASQSGRRFVVESPRIRALLLYAMSDQYFLARYESGLGERPYLFA